MLFRSKYREADFGGFPKGLIYGLQCMDSWLYDENQPFLHLEAGETFAFLREQLEQSTGYFEELVKTWLLDNTHGSLVVVRPKKGLTAENEKALEKKLADYKATLSEKNLQGYVQRTADLKEYQTEPSPKEELEKIPLLQREDVKKEAAPLSNLECTMAGLPVVYHNIGTNGIYYVSMMFKLNHLSAEDLPYLGVLKSVLGYMDTEHYSYGELANEINIYTGGISSALNFYANAKDGKSFDARYEVNVKVLKNNLSRAFSLV